MNITVYGYYSWTASRFSCKQMGRFRETGRFQLACICSTENGCASIWIFAKNIVFQKRTKKPVSGILINRLCQSVPDFFGRNQKGSSVNTEPGVQCAAVFLSACSESGIWKGRGFCSPQGSPQPARFLSIGHGKVWCESAGFGLDFSYDSFFTAKEH